MKNYRYKGWLIVHREDTTSGHQVFLCYTPEEAAFPAGLRSVEWEACSLQEARDFINSY